VSDLYSEAPVLTPADLQRPIDTEGIDAMMVVPPFQTPTVADAAAALGVEPAQIIKSLLFLVREQPVLVIACGAAPIDRHALTRRYGVGKKQVRLAGAETVLRVLGYPVGGVPPFGHLTDVPVLLDAAIRAWDAVYGGGGDEHTLLRIAPDELQRVSGGEWIELGG